MSNSILATLSAVIEEQSKNSSVIEMPDNAPFDAQQRQWLNGLLTGISTLAVAANSGAPAEEAGTPLAIYYGSQSGNSEVLAKNLKKYAASQGFSAVIEELDAINLADLGTLQHLLIICSTFGEGEPPDNAKKFYAALMAEDAPTLPASLNFSVCGLGDSSYQFFNQCAADMQARLAQLGATPTSECAMCDLAFEDDYEQWKDTLFSAAAFSSAAGAANAPDTENSEPEAIYSKNHPFIANLLHCEKLSSDDSVKVVNHIEISLAGGGADMHYEVGDALGVWPLNCPAQVSEILLAGGFSGREIVRLKSAAATLRAMLTTKLDIMTVNAKALQTWGIVPATENYQVFDVLNELKPALDAQTFVDGLRPLQPRLYSIASSSKAHPGEVHLTVGEVHYQLMDKTRKGVASTWLGERLTVGSNLGVYVQKSAHFHLPNDHEAPLIMIGPGTGIAPFRAFLEEREVTEASGMNWLFYGDQHRDHDYLYQQQLEAWQTSGLLNNLSLAWSRDSQEKIYVQSLIRERGADFFEWLEQGAYLYICGDASRMAADVDIAIREVIATHGKLDESATAAYMDKLVAEHRYQRDVY
ncbi:MAG: sulfite reductase flavoprotein subunit alpha [Oceanospirillaceae bacterium]|nr:sulfite reductase flavoprotein subunit alpha [Oceanospirillaceae bacterium]